MKPYRLINDIELQAIQLTLETRLKAWNAEYALFPLSCIVKRNLHDNTCHPREGGDPSLMWYMGNTENGSLPSRVRQLAILQQTLFGNNSDCFNTLTETLFQTLKTELLGTQTFEPIEDWGYPGSPSLTLTLENTHGAITCQLHPQWVLNALPIKNITKRPITKLHDALSTQPVDLQVELTPLKLKLADIIRLHLGDVIKTDHPITEPAQLTHQHKTLCNVDIGESNSYKSIQITRTS